MELNSIVLSKITEPNSSSGRGASWDIAYPKKLRKAALAENRRQMTDQCANFWLPSQSVKNSKESNLLTVDCLIVPTMV
jgi:hypothetical protein